MSNKPIFDILNDPITSDDEKVQALKILIPQLRALPKDPTQPEYEDGNENSHWGIFGETQAWHTPLWHAASLGLTACVNLFIEEGARITSRCCIDSDNLNEMLPITIAAKNGHAKCVKLLIDAHQKLLDEKLEEENLKPENQNLTHQHKASNATFIKNAILSHFDESVIYAAINNDAEILNLLMIANANVNAKNSKGVSALFIAAGYGNAKAVKILCEHHADFDEDLDSLYNIPSESENNFDVSNILEYIAIKMLLLRDELSKLNLAEQLKNKILTGYYDCLHIILQKYSQKYGTLKSQQLIYKPIIHGINPPFSLFDVACASNTPELMSKLLEFNPPLFSVSANELRNLIHAWQQHDKENNFENEIAACESFLTKEYQSLLQKAVDIVEAKSDQQDIKHEPKPIRLKKRVSFADTPPLVPQQPSRFESWRKAAREISPVVAIGGLGLHLFGQFNGSLTASRVGAGIAAASMIVPIVDGLHKAYMKK